MAMTPKQNGRGALQHRLERNTAASHVASSVLSSCQMRTTTHYHGCRAMLMMIFVLLLLLFLYLSVQLPQSHFSLEASPILHDKKPSSPQQTGSSKSMRKQVSSSDHHAYHQDGVDGSIKDEAFQESSIQKKNVVLDGDDDDDDDGKPVLYSYARPDRSGAAIQDMMFAHAFAFSENATYGGACDVAEQQQQKNLMMNEGEGTVNLTPEQILEHRKDQHSVVQMLGLQDILPFACPKDRRRGIILNRFDYYQQDTRIWSREWVQHIQSVITYYPNTPRPSHTTTTTALQVAVHVRRGDVTPCSTHASRYLPNSYYLNVLDTYLPQNETLYEVSIYSDGKTNNESSFLERWEPFVQRNYSLNLDTNALDAWKAIISADIFIMSKSSMSLVAAMLNTNNLQNRNKKRSSTIIYTPFWHQPLEDWIVVQDNLVQGIQPEVERLQQLAGGCQSSRKV
jgi:hypothetical protein